jgi:asparagine synthase (glutamine-hydrolysing)
MLNPQFVQWAVNLPEHWKQADGNGKIALKRAAALFLPKSIISRKKQGFSVPLAAWFRGKMGQSFEMDIQRGGSFMSGDYINPDEIALLLHQHRGGVRDHSRTLWLCWIFERFMRDVHSVAPNIENPVLTAV